MKKGYTLIEFLSVISLIGIMTSVAVPAYSSLQDEAKLTKATAEVKTLQTIVERYQQQKGSYPETLDLKEFDSQINITNKLIKNPFNNLDNLYEIELGKTKNNQDYYVIYSKGANKKMDFYIENDQIHNDGDDILISNLLIIE